MTQIVLIWKLKIEKLKIWFVSLKHSISFFIKVIKRCINELYDFCNFYIFKHKIFQET